MAELYPSDAQLNALSGTQDPQQEVLYVATGESPYFTSFYKMLYRLLDVARRAGDFRVYKDGPLTFGVRPGRLGGTAAVIEYPGDTQLPLSDNATHHIYLAADGSVVTSTEGLPLPSDQPYLPLATITTAGGGYSHSDIIDLRGAGMFRLLDGLSAVDLQALVPTLTLTTLLLSGGRWSVVMRLLDAGGRPLRRTAMVRVWISPTTMGLPNGAGNTVSVLTGAVHTTIAAGAEYLLLTDLNGEAELTLLAPEGERVVMAETGGLVVTTGTLEFSS